MVVVVVVVLVVVVVDVQQHAVDPLQQPQPLSTKTTAAYVSAGCIQNAIVRTPPPPAVL